MKYLISLFSILFLIGIYEKSFGQHIDSTHTHAEGARDSSYFIHENVPKSKFLGNSWYFATSYNLSKTNEFDFNVGRTYGKTLCGGAGCYYWISSWGLGYGLTNKNGKQSEAIKAFW